MAWHGIESYESTEEKWAHSNARDRVNVFEHNKTVVEKKSDEQRHQHQK